MTRKLEGKVALVTGAGRGIGRSIALKLAGEGARLVLNDLDQEVGESAAKLIKDSGGQALTCIGSVSDPAFPERFLQTAMDGFGGMDIIVNNAGYTWDSVIQKMTDEQWHSIIDCHMTAPFRILRAAQPIIRSLVKSDQVNGRRNVRKVVNVSSMSGMFGNAGQTNYAGAKAGIIGMTKALAKEWGRLHVTVNSVSYGLINTRLINTSADHGGISTVEGHAIKFGVNRDLLANLEQTIPMGRVGTTEEAAGAVYLLCIPESDYISGHNLVCSGGLTGV